MSLRLRLRGLLTSPVTVSNGFVLDVWACATSGFWMYTVEAVRVRIMMVNVMRLLCFMAHTGYP